MRFHVDVTQKDIDSGARKSPHLCPLAVAARRQFPSERIMVHVGIVGIWFYDLPCLMVDVGKRTFVVSGEPGAALEKVTRYDETGVMEPFSVELFSVRTRPLKGYAQRTPRDAPERCKNEGFDLFDTLSSVSA